MKISMTLQNDHMRVTISAENDYEKRVLGMFAAGEGRVTDAQIECHANSHHTHGKVDTATITFARVNHEH